MPDGDSKTYKKIKRKGTSNTFNERYVPNVSSFLQSFWVRCRTIFPDTTDRKFMESEFRLVLYCGILFWSIYLLFTITK